MTKIETLLREINRDLGLQFEERLRAVLAEQDREWLVDQIVRLTLDRQDLREKDRRGEQEAKAKARADRVERVRALALDRSAVEKFVAEHGGATHESLVADGRLLAGASPRGTVLLTSQDRTESGEALLQRAKDVLFALLFGDGSNGTRLRRNQQELLTVVLPRAKGGALDFMQASTELAAMGTWQDPDNVSNDDRADNVLIEVQYGDIAEESVGNGIVVALNLINRLEINEKVLYANMINIEEGTLIE
jgi:hypothetical protein